QKYFLASYLEAYYYDHAPDYAVLNLAVLRNDQKVIQQLLLKPDALPRRERIHAAKQIGDLPKAQMLAHDAAKRRLADDASEVYEKMGELMLLNADNFQFGEEHEQFGSLIGPRTFLRTKIFFTPKWSAGPYGIVWDARRSDTLTFSKRSYVQKLAGIMFTRQTERSNLDIDIGGRQNIYNNFYAGLVWDYRLTSRLTLDGVLNYNYLSYLNNFMQVAGTQDSLRVGGSYQYTLRDFFQLGFEYDRYHIQDRAYLGNGRLYYMGLTHKITLDYPDYHLDFFGSINQYTDANTDLSGEVASIFLPGTIPNSANIIPQNFWQVAFVFSVGRYLKDDYDEFGNFNSRYGGAYSHAWRPYLVVGPMYQSTAGPGPLLNLGLVGSVFGRDKLSFYYSYSTLNQGIAQTNSLIGLRYQMYL
ncbi:hypothetical protein N9L02_02940, partial [Gammaproteobacteria bacterium]|nr:hypothetical protein [Gammaproteobacteria bacterium]